MKKIFYCFIVLLIFKFFIITESIAQDKPEYCIVVHGGAGNFNSSEFDTATYWKYYNSIKEVLLLGDSLLSNGIKAIDVVEKCAVIFENSPLFNAGKGAVINSKGEFELDASIMDGSNLKAGAVAGVKTVKNPIKLARMVMDSTAHVMLIGAGAEEFAYIKGIEIVDPEYFETPEVMKKYKSTVNDKNGTIGVVALDKYGNLAAATSTGGMMMKKYGRVGDSPIIGAGTYADSHYAAVSCTGHGEYFIRTLCAYNLVAAMKYANMNIVEAAENAILQIANLGGTGGLIAVDKYGNVVFNYNSKSMFRGYKKSNTNLVIEF
ncbi:MAG: isoaspartyl peptidase/L-asparaginase [Bacteroidales bacterium]|jgi:beta-aspartyl-peptidase (threonine type)